MQKVITQIKGKLSSDMVKDILWTVFGQVAVMLVLLVTNKIVSVFLSVDDFGIFNIIKKNSQVLAFAMLGGAGIAIPKYLAFYKTKKQYFKFLRSVQSSFIYVLALIIVFATLSVLLYNYLYIYLVGKDDGCLYLAAILYSINLAVAQLLFCYFRGNDNFKYFTLYQIIFQLITLIPLCFVGMLSPLFIYITWSVIGILFIAIVTLKEFKRTRFAVFKNFNLSMIKPRLIEFTIYSLPRLLGDFFLFAISAFPLIFIGRHSTLENVSLYSIGITLSNMVTPIFSFLGIILLPYVSKCLAENKLDIAVKNIKKLSVVYLGFASAATLFLYFLMPFLIQIFFDAKYLSGVEFSRIIILSIVPQSMYLLFRNPIDAISKIPYNTIILGVTFAVLIVAFIYSNNLSDYAIAFLIASTLEGLMSIAAFLIARKTN